jgi:single-strand DNA-binding protein
MHHEIELIGRLGRDPEMKYTSAGKPFTTLSVATDYKWTATNGEQKKQVIWWRVTAWGRQAETCNEHLHKGDMVFVKGRADGDRVAQADGSEQVVPHTWTGQDGQVKASFQVNASFVRFLGGGGGQGQPRATAPAPASNTLPGFDDDEDEIPF